MNKTMLKLAWLLPLFVVAIVVWSCSSEEDEPLMDLNNKALVPRLRTTAETQPGNSLLIELGAHFLSEHGSILCSQMTNLSGPVVSFYANWENAYPYPVFNLSYQYLIHECHGKRPVIRSSDLDVITEEGSSGRVYRASQLFHITWNGRTECVRAVSSIAVTSKGFVAFENPIYGYINGIQSL